MAKLTTAQQKIMQTLRTEAEAVLVGDFVTRCWKLRYRVGGFMPSGSVTQVTVEALIRLKQVMLQGHERGVFTYVATPE